MAMVARNCAGFSVLAALALGLAAPAHAQNYSEGYRFLEAVKELDGTTATDLLQKPGSTVINSRDLTSGQTGLHLTIAKLNPTWTRWLLQEGANPNIADKNGVYPIMLAVRIGFLGGVEALIEGGAQVDVRDRTGETPLMSAVHSGNLDLIEMLLKAGADPDRNDNTGRSARDYAEQQLNNSRLMAKIAEHEKPAAERAGAKPTYGPSF